MNDKPPRRGITIEREDARRFTTYIYSLPDQPRIDDVYEFAFITKNDYEVFLTDEELLMLKLSMNAVVHRNG